MDDLASRFREYMHLDKKHQASGLTVDELRRWHGLKRTLHKHFGATQPDDVLDQRQSVRVPARLRVNFESYGQMSESLMTNLSRGGLFISTEMPLDIGTLFDLTIHVEEPEAQLQISCEVVSLNVGPDMRTQERGMGVRFVHLDDREQEAVRKLYECAAGEALSHETRERLRKAG